jgi:Zn-dependent protease with chaperone function
VDEAPTPRLAPDPGHYPCPKCGAIVPVADDWCDQCDWNVDPEAGKERKRRRQRAELRANRRSEQLYKDLLRAQHGGRPRRNLARFASTVMAAFVTLVLPLLAVGTALIWWRFGLSPASVIATALVVPLAIETRPRAGKLGPREMLLERDQAPALYRFVEELVPLVGTRRPPVLGVSGEFNASTSKLGWRQQPLVVIGLALWDVLGPQERTAVICHELGHDLRGDLVHGALVNNSLRTLRTWHRVLATNPGRLQNRSIIPELVLGALGAVAKRVLLLQLHLAMRGSPLAEYRADEAAARVASSAAAASTLERLLIGRVASQFVAFHISRRNPDVLAATHKSICTMTSRQRERLVRAARLRGQAVDASHPPTLLRIDFVQKVGVQKPLFVLGSERSAAIDAEIDAVRDRVNELLLNPRRRRPRKRRSDAR